LLSAIIAVEIIGCCIVAYRFCVCVLILQNCWCYNLVQAKQLKQSFELLLVETKDLSGHQHSPIFCNARWTSRS